MALQIFSWASATTASKRRRIESGASESLHIEVYLDAQISACRSDLRIHQILIHENVLKTHLQSLYDDQGFSFEGVQVPRPISNRSLCLSSPSSLTSSAHEWNFWLISCELTMSTPQPPSRRSNPNEAMDGANETLRTVQKSIETELTPKAPNAPSPEV